MFNIFGKVDDFLSKIGASLGTMGIWMIILDGTHSSHNIQTEQVPPFTPRHVGMSSR